MTAIAMAGCSSGAEADGGSDVGVDTPTRSDGSRGDSTDDRAAADGGSGPDAPRAGDVLVDGMFADAGPDAPAEDVGPDEGTFDASADEGVLDASTDAPVDGAGLDTPEGDSPATLDAADEAPGLDVGPDAPPPDGPVDDASPDGGPDASPDGGGGDGGPGTTAPAPPPTITRMGAGGFLLRGTVLLPTGPLVGEVLVVGNTITCVAADCTDSPSADTVTVIDTHSVISPGLIDGHNHLTYNFLPEWEPAPAREFLSRYQWRGDAQYGTHVDPEGDSNADGTQDTGAQCPGAKWGELRSIIHGTTMVQGQSPQSGCMDRLARNVDHFHGLGSDIVRTTISGPCESGFPARASLTADFVSGNASRFFVHMAEGYMATTPGSNTDPLREWDCYAGRSGSSTVSLLFDAANMPYGTSVFIHAIPSTMAQLDEAVTAGVRFVWSPSSNLILYGRTAPIAEMMRRNLVIGMGPDWTVSGSDEMLSEMRFAFDYGVETGIALSPQRLWQMATFDGADVAGHGDLLGTIAVGYRADLVVFGRTGADPYRAVLDSRARDVRLTLIDGVGYYGDAALQAATAVNSSCEALDVCGEPKFICVAGTPGNASRAADTMSSLSTELLGILGTYNRTDLLPLVDCSQ
jgi:hypothetical protein